MEGGVQVMSNTIDNRAINLGFDNKQFETGVKQSTDSLDKLKKGLDLTEQARSLQNLAAAGRAFNIGPIAEGVQNISSKFSALGVIGITVLQNLTNAVMDLGKKMWTSITAPAKKGFSEYETQMNAIQTIMANTASKGTTLQQVNDILEEMNVYADKTIYSFPEMAKNMGTFTAAGIELNVAAGAIKGIANLAAVSGSNSQQAATAMYQLSQALSSGTVKLMDWNSVVNAGMGGQVFQDALKETARLHGVAIDDMIKSEGSFRETLQKGWLTSDILTETLSKFTGDLNAEQLKTMGYTEEQIAGIIKLGETANDAATKVKTLSQLRETMAEALQSGWAKTWQIILGDFGQAKVFFTYLNDTFGALIQGSSDARNNMVQGWADLGGRTAAIEALKNVINTVLRLMGIAKDVWNQMFPSKGPAGSGLYKITKLLKDFTDALKPSMDTTKKLSTIFGGLFAILDIGKMAITALLGSFGKLDTSGIKPALTSMLNYVTKLSLHLLMVRSLIKSNNTFGKAIERIKEYFVDAKVAVEDFVIKVTTAFMRLKIEFLLLKEGVKNALGGFKEGFQSAFDLKKINIGAGDGFFDKLLDRFKPLEILFKFVSVVMDGLIGLLAKSAPILLKLGTWLGKILGQLGTAIFDAVSTLDFSNLFDTLNAGFLGAFLVTITKFMKSGTGTLDSLKNMFQGVSGILDAVRGSLEAYQQNLKSKTLLNIAIAIGILAAALLVLSLIDSKKLATAIGSVTILFADLTLSMAGLNKGGSGLGAAGLSLTLIAISVSLLILTAAIKKISDIDPAELKSGLAGLTLISAGLVLFMRTLGANAKSFVGAAISIAILAVGLKIIASVVEKLGSIDPARLQNGLIAIGLVLAELAAFTQLASNKMGVSSGVGILALVGAILLMSVAVEKFGNMDIGVLKQGLITIGAILLALGVFIRLAGNGKNVIATAIGMAILGGAMLIFAEAITRMGNLTWDQLSKGMAGMAGALLAIVIAVNLMPKNMIVTAVALAIIAGAIYILANSLTTMSDMTWEEIGKGLATLAGALLIISIAMYAMQGSIGGAVALLVVAGALAVMAPVLKTLGSMGLTEIAIALGVLAAMFIILGIAGAVLTPVVPTLLGLAVSIVLIGAAVALIGVGLLMFSTGLAALAVSGVAGATAFVAMVAILLGIIPMLITAIVDGIILFAKLIIEAYPVVGEAMITLIQTMCTVIIETVPDIVAALTVLLNALWQLIRDQVPQAIDAILFIIGELLLSLADSIPQFTQSAFDILIGFLKGIRDNIAEVVTVVGEIITEFLDAVGLKLPDIIQSGFDLLISFIDGITKAVEENGPDLQTAIGNLAAAIIKGLTDGLLGSIQSIVDVIGTIGSAIITALKTLLGIASPSKVTEEMGINLAQGFVKGMSKNANNVVNASENLGKKAISGMSAAVRRINDALNDNLDINPVIRPVMDLTAVEIGGRNINNLLGKKSIQLSGSLNNLSLAATRMINQNGSQELINKPVNQGTTVTFYQTNTSPKALSAFEIYRQTRNQLLSLKGLVISE